MIAKGFDLQEGIDWEDSGERDSYCCLVFHSLSLECPVLSALHPLLQEYSQIAGGAEIRTLRQNPIKQYLKLHGEEFVLETYSVGTPVEIFWGHLLSLTAESGPKEAE